MKSYQIVYAVAHFGALEIETADFHNEQDARVAFAALCNRPNARRLLISATLADPDDNVIEEYDA